VSDRPALRRHALVIEVLARLDGPDAAAGWEHLRALWHGCAYQLGMSSPVPALGVPAHLPRHPGDVAPGRQSVLLAACQRYAPGIWQALARREHDVVCLLAALAPESDTEPQDDTEPTTEDNGIGWEHLEMRWAALAEDQDPSVLLGEVASLPRCMSWTAGGTRAAASRRRRWSTRSNPRCPDPQPPVGGSTVRSLPTALRSGRRRRPPATTAACGDWS
jgi:hypothetical protein